MSDEVPSSTELLGRVDNATRFEILRSLANACHESPPDPWLEYSELRDAVSIRDKGNFNYHLDRLGDLIEKGPAGYCISSFGMQVVSAIASGTLDPDWTWGPIDAPGECVFCGDSVTFRYEDGALRLSCGTDDHTLLLPGSPSLLDTGPEETIVERIALSSYHEFALTYRGICPGCEGYVDGTIHRDDVRPEHYHYHADCPRCGFQSGFPVGIIALFHPDVISFFAEHGTDVRSTPFWTLDFCRPGHETVLSTDPLRFRVDVTKGDETLSVVLNDGEDRCF
ncbi:hypothetical protein A4G99_02175 [Haladaptatus sp. R4]|uniref:DUF7351 domain-containing protein n=1 Tax=Haladaptatus sp. R4 TaxID=1679489 RepID=UPI0007B46FD5|nr:hypothetical protein [Haladaptatus sp. R4]KZN25333.1 hypothetical protein A4G99_02175 [Haladaptatus sp. R4]